MTYAKYETYDAITSVNTAKMTAPHQTEFYFLLPSFPALPKITYN